MAEACRLGSQSKAERNPAINQDENFCVFNVLCVFISLVTILADLTTVILVFAEYCKNGYVYWASATLTFILTPNILINVFSMRWLTIDQEANLKNWISHGCLVGLLERYVLFLHNIYTCQNLDTKKLVHQRNDLSLLHFLYIFTGTIPQIILQTFAVITMDENYYTKVFALAASNASVLWGCTTYIYSIMAVQSQSDCQWVSLLLRLVWHFGMLIARISGILLFTTIFGIWTLLPLGLHWTAMTFWIIIQNTSFCPSKLEESFYNIVMGLVYCFSYINLRDGHTRYRLMMFYTLMLTQNFGSLFLYILVSDSEQQQKPWSICATVCIIVGTAIGLSAMILYYRHFHSKGPIPWKYVHEDIELNNKITIQNCNSISNNDNGLQHVRSFKSVQNKQIDDKSSRNAKQSSDPTPHHENENADKKFLLDHWIARSGTPTFTSAPVGNISMNTSSIELYTVENTPQSFSITAKPNKKVTICSPTELNLKLSTLENLECSIDEITSSNLNLQKRRGICSSDELRDAMDDLDNLNLDTCNMINESFNKGLKADHSSVISHDTDGSNKKTSTDSFDMDLDLSFSDINSSDINTFNENIVQKLCLSALKNIKVGNQDADIENIQRIALDILKEMYSKKDRSKTWVNNDSFSSKQQRDLDTPTELLSVHDYENICAVNIAREAWGLRSWNGYCDIENWLHDGSVVRDRRRDTLTSASTEISSCISQELKNAIFTAPPFPKKVHTYTNVFVKFDKSNHEDYMNTASCLSTEETFLAKPCIIDTGKDQSHLEPIMEELDDLGDIDSSNKKRLNSESSLVATIDEIRKATATNSPRNLYHRREPMWNSPEFNTSSKIDPNLKRALWKEPFKFNSSNIMETLPEKENILRVQSSKFELNKKEVNLSSSSTSLDRNSPDSLNYNKNTRRRQKSNTSNLKPQNKRNNHKSEHQLQDLSNKDIDFLWQLVSENSFPAGSTEDFTSSRRTSSLQSLINKDTNTTVTNTSTAKISNLKKGVKTRPRRKFSILRERFEPKIILNSDEETLYYGSELALNQCESNSTSLRNEIQTDDNNLGMSSQNGYLNLTCNNMNANLPLPSQICESNIGKNIKEKRSLFMKQVLSPPKFNTKLRHKI